MQSFPPPLSTFFLDFAQAADQEFFSYHILMNILSTNYYNYFVIKKSINNILYGKLSLNYKQHSKTKK